MFPALLIFGRVYEKLVLIFLLMFGVHFHMVVYLNHFHYAFCVWLINDLYYFPIFKATF